MRHEVIVFKHCMRDRTRMLPREKRNMISLHIHLCFLLEEEHGNITEMKMQRSQFNALKMTVLRVLRRSTLWRKRGGHRSSCYGLLWIFGWGMRWKQSEITWRMRSRIEKLEVKHLWKMVKIFPNKNGNAESKEC